MTGTLRKFRRIADAALQSARLAAREGDRSLVIRYADEVEWARRQEELVLDQIRLQLAERKVRVLQRRYSKGLTTPTACATI